MSSSNPGGGLVSLYNWVTPHRHPLPPPHTHTHPHPQVFTLTVGEFLTFLEDRALGLPPELCIAKSAEQAQRDEAAAAAQQAEAGPAAGMEADGAAAAGEGDDAASLADVTSENGEEKGGQQAQQQPRKPLVTLSDPGTLASLATINAGCCIARLCDADADALGFSADADAAGGLAANAPLAVGSWRGRTSFNILVSKQECAQMAAKIRTAQSVVAAEAAAM